MSAVCSVPYIVQQHDVSSVQCAVHCTAARCQQCTVCHTLYNSMMSAVYSVPYNIQQHDVSSVQCAIHCTTAWCQQCTVCCTLNVTWMSAMHTHTSVVVPYGNYKRELYSVYSVLLCGRILSPILFRISYLNTWNNKICFLTRALKEII